MTGILLVAVVLVWLALTVTLTRWIIRVIKSPGLKLFAGIVVFLVLLVAPLLDELIGAFQFDSLCRRYAVQEIDAQNAMNRQVVFVPRGDDKFAEGTAVRIRIDPHVYKDAQTERVLVTYHTLHAEGGWLVRATKISATNSPMLFRSGCGPRDEDAFKKNLNITVIN